MLILCPLKIVALLFMYMPQIPLRKTNRMVFLLFRHLEQHIIHFCKDKTKQILKLTTSGFSEERHREKCQNRCPYYNQNSVPSKTRCGLIKQRVQFSSRAQWPKFRSLKKNADSCK